MELFTHYIRSAEASQRQQVPDEVGAKQVIMAARVRYLLQIIFALLISALGFFQLSERMNGKPTSGSVVMQIVCAIMFLVAWGLMSRFQKFGNQSIFACVLMLTSIGILMISRIDARWTPPWPSAR